MDRLAGKITKRDGGLSMEWADGSVPAGTGESGAQAVVLGPAASRRDDLAGALAGRPEDPASALAPLHRMASGFAFALWEPQEGQLSLGSDPLGLQSIYYRESEEGLIFGTRLSDVAPPGQREKLHLAACEHFLAFLSVPPGRTMIGGVRRMLPGAMLSFPSNGSGSRSLFPLEAETPPSFAAAAERLREVLRTYTRAAVQDFPPNEPLGLLLSGGIDSTALLALLREAWKGPIVGIHTGPEGSPDRTYAGEMAKRYGAELLDVTLTARDAGDSLAWIVASMEAPTGNASAVANCRAFASARERGIRRIFSGLGSDEMFCGHAKHLLAPWWPRLARLPRPLRVLAARAASRWGQTGLSRALAAEKSGSEMHRAMYAFFGADEFEGLRGGLAPFAEAAPLPWKEADDAGFPAGYGSEILQADLNLWLRSALTPMAGALAAANGIELYLPFCAPGVLNLSASLPLSWKVRGREGKRVLRRAVSELIPDEILRRPRRGFTVPMTDWLRGDLAGLTKELLSPSRVEQWSLLKAHRISRLSNDHFSGKGDWALPLWAWMTFSVWHERFVEGANRSKRMERLSE